MPDRGEWIARLEALYGGYLDTVAALERDRRFGDGIFGMKGGPGDDPCHERFAEELRGLLDEFASAAPASGDVRELLGWICDAPLAHREPRTAYWMLIAVQGLTRPLLDVLAPEDAAALRQKLEKSYPRYARMPVQNELLRELKKKES